jgi:hypothetical protein
MADETPMDRKWFPNTGRTAPGLAADTLESLSASMKGAIIVVLSKVTVLAAGVAGAGLGGVR